MEQDRIPDDVLKSIERLERKRQWREYWTPERIADKVDELLDREKEKFGERKQS